LQQLGRLGSIYGFVDVLVKLVSDERVTEVTPPVSSSCGLQDLGEPPMNDEPSSDGAGSSEGNGAAVADQSAEALPPAAGSAPGEAISAASTGASTISLQALLGLARRIRLEIVEPARALPILSAD